MAVSNHRKKRKKSSPFPPRKSTSSKQTLSSGTLLLPAFFLLIGLLIGVTLCQFLTQKDTFCLVGEKEYTITCGEEYLYVEEGVEVIAFGKDLSDRLVISTNLTYTEDGYRLDTSTPGQYYIAYTVDSFYYQDIQLVRNFTVTP
jgi:hypothetical protein